MAKNVTMFRGGKNEINESVDDVQTTCTSSMKINFPFLKDGLA